MRLSHIEIENFKGIGPKQCIEIKPITLLLGANSAGKSSILQSLHYLREILERNNVNADQTVSGGNIDLGGFKSLVHRHELNRAVRIKIKIDLDNENGNEYLPLNSGASLRENHFQNLPIRYITGNSAQLDDNALVKNIGIGVEVRWSQLANTAYVSRLDIELDDQPLCSILSSSGTGRAVIQDINFEHDLLQEITDLEDISELDEDFLEDFKPGSPEYEYNEDLIAQASGDPMSNPIGIGIWEYSREHSVENLGSEKSPMELRIGVETGFGALPDANKTLRTDFIDDKIDESVKELEKAQIKSHDTKRSSDIPNAVAFEFNLKKLLDDKSTIKGLKLIWNELITGPIRITSDYLKEMIYIGPLRDIPERNFKPKLSPVESRWASGVAAWDLLHTETGSNLINNLSNWMEAAERLNTGYRLKKVEIKQITTDSPLNYLLEEGMSEDYISEIQEMYEATNSSASIELTKDGVSVSPIDVGVGISQMIPVVVSCLMKPKGLVAIEQPELHIHPAVQVGMGDLFIEATSNEDTSIDFKRTLLIETHSEHIILRLLRRIRELNDNELPPGIRGSHPDDVSVIYIDATEEGPQFNQMKISKDGDFSKKWSKGFFEERSEELF